MTYTAIHTPVHMHVCTNMFLIHIHAFTHLHTLALRHTQSYSFTNMCDH